MKFKNLLALACVLLCVFAPARADLLDQGLGSIMEIIDKAIARLAPEEEDAELDEATIQNAMDTVVNLSRTLGTLSYSRLQCGEAAVLAEFTQRVQRMPEEQRDPMRDAFQEGFDKSKEETELLSQDECERLTRSRNRSEQGTEAKVREIPEDEKKARAAAQSAEQVPEAEDPKYRHMRIAEMSGQLAYKRRFCADEKVFNRDYNEYLESIPAKYREEVKAAYWKGYQRGKRLNKGLTRDKCMNQSS